MDAAALALPFLFALVVVALVFDFMNGFHDSANSIALMVSTRLLTPQAAVIWAAFFNFIAFLFFGLHVANTVGSGIVHCDYRQCGHLRRAVRRHRLEHHYLVVRHSLVSSHGLIGGLVGAGTGQSRLQAMVGQASARPRRDHPVAAAGLVLAIAMSIALSGFSIAHASGGRQVSTNFSSSRRRCTASATAATMRRKPWASSPCCSIRTAT